MLSQTGLYSRTALQKQRTTQTKDLLSASESLEKHLCGATVDLKTQTGDSTCCVITRQQPRQ